MKGLFITFEGIEGCGKSTQAELLADYFRQQGREVLLTREPGGPKISESIRNILLNRDNREMLPETELLLYMASRSQHTGEWIIPALNRGEVVISDRYYDSSLAYQGAARQITREIIDPIVTYATFGLIPWRTILIDLPAARGLARIKAEEADRLESESLEFHEKVRQAYLQLAESETKRYIIIDGNRSIEEIHKDLIYKINEALKVVANET
ncbi:MAG: dTMP kinase [Candidatus Cloacimonetes bacterium]|nr:dTMP kinase [Candidatus Cloacimonadota bacterium]